LSSLASCLTRTNKRQKIWTQP